MIRLSLFAIRSHFQLLTVCSTSFVIPNERRDCSSPHSGDSLTPRCQGQGVMSSCLCKNPEGAIFPFQVEALDDGVDDSIHTLHFHEADHGPSAAPNLPGKKLLSFGAVPVLPFVRSMFAEPAPPHPTGVLKDVPAISESS